MQQRFDVSFGGAHGVFQHKHSIAELLGSVSILRGPVRKSGPMKLARRQSALEFCARFFRGSPATSDAVHQNNRLPGKFTQAYRTMRGVKGIGWSEIGCVVPSGERARTRGVDCGTLVVRLLALHDIQENHLFHSRDELVAMA